MKQKDNLKLLGLFGVFIIAAVAVTYFLVGGAQEQAISGVIDEETGETIGPWSNTLVKLNMLTSDEYDGSDVAATAKVYEEKPADWGNPRGDFDDTALFTQYTASSGVVTIDEQFPGTHYVVLTASGYNTEFVEIEIPDGSTRNIDVADYNAAPDSVKASMALVGATTDEDFDFTLVNDTTAELSEQLTLKVTENTEFRGWKAVITDEEGMSTDADNDGTYDEGVSELTVTIGSEKVTIFEPDSGVDEFDSNDKYTLLLDDMVVKSEKFLNIAVDIVADTGDYVGANDEVWGEGEGVLSYIYIYDDEGNLFATVDIGA